MSHISQIEKIRERARQHITQGAVTEDYKLDRKQAIAILNEALATEIVCVLRYSFHYFMATGIHSQAVKAEFKEHAREEQEHAERIAVETYREIIKFFGDRDPTSRIMMEEILSKEEEHADDMADLLFAVEPATGEGTRPLYFADEVPESGNGGKQKAAGKTEPNKPAGSVSGVPGTRPS